MDHRQHIKASLRGWDFLEQERQQKIINTDTIKALESLSDAIDSAIDMKIPKSSDGMIEMRRIFDLSVSLKRKFNK